jgi:membrane-associated phospholipid phosphatase
MQAPTRQDSRVLRDWTDVATPFGTSVPIVASVGLWGVGRLAHDSVLADVGLHVTEGIGAAGVTTLVLKILVGRARPYVGTHDPHAFGEGRLTAFDSRYESFPSGHTTVAFAAAAAATAEVSAHWPGKQWVVGPILYGAAASVAFARMYDDKHWASDVTAGAVVGTLVGNRVVHAVHTGGGWLLTRLDPILLFLPGRGPVVGVRYALP